MELVYHWNQGTIQAQFCIGSGAVDDGVTKHIVSSRKCSTLYDVQ